MHIQNPENRRRNRFFGWIKGTAFEPDCLSILPTNYVQIRKKTGKSTHPYWFHCL